MLKLARETVRVLTADPQPAPVPEGPQPQDVVSEASLKQTCQGTKFCCRAPP